MLISLTRLYSACLSLVLAFLLDLPTTVQVFISIAFFCASLLVADFVEALLGLWQAIAVAGLFFVLFDYASDIPLNQSVCALSIPFVWAVTIVFKRLFSEVKAPASGRFDAELVGVISTALLFFVAPRGQLQNLSFLGRGEDSALYMWASSGLLRGEELHLATGFGASSYLYFYNFLNNGFLHLSKLSWNGETNSLLISLNVLSNMWVFVLVSSILFSIRIALLIRQKFVTGSSDFSLYILISGSSFLFFRASQDNGHFTQYLLNAAVFVFLISLIATSKEARVLPKLGSVVLTLATALSLVGSYGPWLPISIIAMVLTVNAIFSTSLIRIVFNSNFWIFGGSLFVVGWALMLRKLYASSNLEMGGGVAVTPLEAVWLVFAFTAILLGWIIFRRIRKLHVSLSSDAFKDDKVETVIVFSTALVITLAILDGTSFNQLTTLSFVVLIGLFFRPCSVKQLISNFAAITEHEEYDCIFVLASTSFLYTLSIYILSRYIGPIYDPMYAGNKSMFTFFGQFSWLMILLLFVGFQSQARLIQFLRKYTLVVTMLFVLGLSSYIRYDGTKEQWWHEATLSVINENPDALIACVNPILTTDYESYKCNHFIGVLTSKNISVLFERLSLGDPISSGITDWFKGTGTNNVANLDNDTKVIVLSQDELGAGALSLFEGVSKNMIEFRVVNP